MRVVGPGRPETRDEVQRRLDTYLEEQAVLGWTKWRVATPDGAMAGRAGFGLFGELRDLGYTLGRRHWAAAWARNWPAR